MFKLIKLAIYAFLGYALYELYLGMSQEQGGQSGGSFGRGGESGGQTITGGGSGTTERTEDAFGASTAHRVGRGVM